jgi:hypothetical protein
MDVITPKIGDRKPYTETLDTGLYFISVPHIEYATADRNAR